MRAGVTLIVGFPPSTCTLLPAVNFRRAFDRYLSVLISIISIDQYGSLVSERPPPCVNFPVVSVPQTVKFFAAREDVSAANYRTFLQQSA